MTQISGRIIVALGHPLAVTLWLVLAADCAAAVTRDREGWTVVTPGRDSLLIYVAANGNDANNGLTPKNPKRTIAGGTALLRNGSPDHLYLRRGDTFTNQHLGMYQNAGGRSANEPWLMTSYGDSGPRPKLLTPPTANGITTGNEALSNCAIIGLHFTPNGRTAEQSPQGISLHNNAGKGASNILVEDCIIDGYQQNVRLTGNFTDTIRWSKVSIRRNTIINSWAVGRHSQGIYASGVAGLLVEENVLDHNGWNAEVGGAQPTIFNHNAYLTHGITDCTFRGNVSSRTSSMGLKFQPSSGTHNVTNNLFLQNGYAAQLGGGAAADQANVRRVGITLSANDNVFLESVKRASNGIGVTLSNINAGEFKRNIVAHKDPTANENPVLLIADGMPGWESAGFGIANFTVEDNVFYGWRGRIVIVQPMQGSPPPVIKKLSFTNNIVQEPDIRFSGPLVDTFTVDRSVVMFKGGRYWRKFDDPNTTMRIGATPQSLAAWKKNTGEASASPQTIVRFADPDRDSQSYAKSLGNSSWEEVVADVSAATNPRSLGEKKWQADTINDYIRAGFEETRNTKGL